MHLGRSVFHRLMQEEVEPVVINTHNDIIAALSKVHSQYSITLFIVPKPNLYSTESEKNAELSLVK